MYTVQQTRSSLTPCSSLGPRAPAVGTFEAFLQNSFFCSNLMCSTSTSEIFKKHKYSQWGQCRRDIEGGRGWRDLDQRRNRKKKKLISTSLTVPRDGTGLSAGTCYVSENEIEFPSGRTCCPRSSSETPHAPSAPSRAAQCPPEASAHFRSS